MAAIIITIFGIILLAVSILIIMYNMNLRRFRRDISQGDNIRLRIKKDFISVLVIARKSPGTLLVKQYGNGLKTRRSMLVSQSNCYPE